MDRMKIREKLLQWCPASLLDEYDQSLESVREEALDHGDKLMQAKLSGFNEGLEEAAKIVENCPTAMGALERKYKELAAAIRALQSTARVAEGGVNTPEEKIADLLAELELLNFMDVGAPRHQRKKEYEHLREFLISLAPGVVQPNFERSKK